MIIVLYYSPKTIYPALLASIRHCHPALTPEQSRLRAMGWLQEYGKEKISPFLAAFGESSGGEIVCPATAAVPPPLLGRTLNSLSALLKDSSGAPTLLAAGPLPPGPAGRWKTPRREERAFWKEIEALVEQTRLRIELIRGQR